MLEQRRASGALVFVAVAAVVLASRLPFLDAGFGIDPDAWRMALASRHLASAGEYEASRLPGYPVPEIVGALACGEAMALNGLVAVLSALGAAFFALTLRKLGSRDGVLAALALAMVPIVYVNSTCAMDYVWALAFALASLYFVVAACPLAAGVLLGLAIGCRMTSGALLVPLCILLVRGGGARRVAADILKLIGASLLVGAVAFVPVALRCEGGFFHHYPHKSYPALALVAYLATVDVWGVVGLVALAAAFGSVVLRLGRGGGATSIPARGAPKLVVACVVGIGLYAAAFLKLPHAGGYWIPAVPFVLILLARLASRRVFVGACVALVISPFVLGVGRDQGEFGAAFSPAAVRVPARGESLVVDVLKGPILLDHSKRVRRLAFVDHVLARGEAVGARAVVVAGFWLPQIQARLDASPDANAEYVYTLDADALAHYLREGYAVYYLPRQRGFNLGLHGVDLDAHGGRPLLTQDER